MESHPATSGAGSLAHVSDHGDEGTATDTSPVGVDAAAEDESRDWETGDSRGEFHELGVVALEYDPNLWRILLVLQRSAFVGSARYGWGESTLCPVT